MLVLTVQSVARLSGTRPGNNTLDESKAAARAANNEAHPSESISGQHEDSFTPSAAPAPVPVAAAAPAVKQKRAALPPGAQNNGQSQQKRAEMIANMRQWAREHNVTGTNQGAFEKKMRIIKSSGASAP